MIDRDQSSGSGSRSSDTRHSLLPTGPQGTSYQNNVMDLCPQNPTHEFRCRDPGVPSKYSDRGARRESTNMRALSILCKNGMARTTASTGIEYGFLTLLGPRDSERLSPAAPPHENHHPTQNSESTWRTDAHTCHKHNQRCNI